ncbi:NADPH-dependent FMN reductase protein (plasmid) [Rhizobium gallicum]|uniref:NADPH-dependent FMN reductase protein n=1 Tax=Rhizobium gallicum TaxID=56730 RepID=A0A1L5NTG4_9HYPH|nr:flavodoxin [Rhizobium gallicum]APO71172.1 NADPH-dependent FMN reductase protein [Rhizobium gallicum]
MIKDISRRALLAAPALLSLGAGTCASAQLTSTPQRAPSNILVAYFSRTGNTRVLAGTLQRTLLADLFEILPSRPYADDYEQTVEQARQERDSGFEPPLKMTVPGMATYETVFLGFPIWGETAPPVIRSFLSMHDLLGKTVRPFVTHGGYGLGNSMTVLAAHARGAQIEPPFSMEADQERRTLNEVRTWLSEIEL